MNSFFGPNGVELTLVDKGTGTAITFHSKDFLLEVRQRFEEEGRDSNILHHATPDRTELTITADFSRLRQEPPPQTRTHRIVQRGAIERTPE